jgi:dCMP deaminase
MQAQPTERLRPSVDEMYLSMADVVARRATCQRLQVGCIIADWERTSVLAMGYNGHHRGGRNGCLRPDEPGNCGCTLHAEENALIKAPYDRGPLVLYATHNPCVACASRILNSRVRRVVFRQLYRSTESIDILRAGGVEVVGPLPAEEVAAAPPAPLEIRLD